MRLSEKDRKGVIRILEEAYLRGGLEIPLGDKNTAIWLRFRIYSTMKYIRLHRDENEQAAYVADKFSIGFTDDGKGLRIYKNELSGQISAALEILGISANTETDEEIALKKLNETLAEAKGIVNGGGGGGGTTSNEPAIPQFGSDPSKKYY